MPKMRRFPDDIEEADASDVTEPEVPTLRRRPADKRWRRPHSDKSSRPASDGEASSQGDTPNEHHG